MKALQENLIIIAYCLCVISVTILLWPAPDKPGPESKTDLSQYVPVSRVNSAEDNADHMTMKVATDMMNVYRTLYVKESRKAGMLRMELRRFKQRYPGT